MIEISHVVLASFEQMEFIIEGMRNPMNSWEKAFLECSSLVERWPYKPCVVGSIPTIPTKK